MLEEEPLAKVGSAEKRKEIPQVDNCVQKELCILHTCYNDVGKLLEGLIVMHSRRHLEVSSEHAIQVFCVDSSVKAKEELIHGFHFSAPDVSAFKPHESMGECSSLVHVEEAAERRD